jgi:hypothetical protein
VAGLERFCHNVIIGLKVKAREISMTTKENSVELEIKLKLPDSLVREAQPSGLLTAQALEALLREEVRRRRVGQSFDAADRLAALPPLTETEVEAEIQAARAERRSSRASGR